MKPKQINLLIHITIGLIVGYFAHRVILVLYQLPSGSEGSKMTFTNLSRLAQEIARYPFNFQFTSQSLIGFLIGFFSLVALYFYFNDSKKYQKGVEHGSAKWGTVKDFKPMVNKVEDKNLLFNNVVKKSSTNKGIPFSFQRNNNVLMVAGSGSGKTYSYVKPNLMQLAGTLIVTDPKGLLVRETWDMFEKAGYKMKVFDVFSMKNTNYFNPFVYIRDDAGLSTVIDMIIEGTNGVNAAKGEPFWDNSEKQVLRALFGLLYYSAKAPDGSWGTKNPKTGEWESCEAPSIPDVGTYITMLNNGNPENNYEDGYLDRLFKKLEQEKGPTNPAVLNWKAFTGNYKGETRVNVTSGPTARFAVFYTPEVRKMTQVDEMEIDKWGEEKTVVFLVIPAMTTTYNFLVTILLKCAFDTLTYNATYQYNGSLPVWVRFLLDELANLGKIPNLAEGLATFRSFNISVDMVIQAISQLKTVYDKIAPSMIQNCDTFIFGGQNLSGDKNTDDVEYVSNILGKTTIDVRVDTPISQIDLKHGNATQYSKVGRELMTADEVRKMDNSLSIVVIRGLPPFKFEKYDLTKHKRFMEISDGDQSKFRGDYKIYHEDSVEVVNEAKEDTDNFTGSDEEYFISSA